MEVYYRGEANRLYGAEAAPSESLCSAPLPARRARPMVVRKAKKKKPSVAPILPDYADKTDSQGADRSAARWDAHLRFALNYRASLQCASQQNDINHKKGTFLIS